MKPLVVIQDFRYAIEMRLVIFFLWGFLAWAEAREMEVRMYRVGGAELVKLHRLLVPVEADASDARKESWIGMPEVDPGFESRFFEKGGGWWDCSKEIKEILLVEEFNGVALISRKKGVVVMNAGVWEHESFAGIVSQHRQKKIQIMAELYTVPKVKAGTFPIGFAKKPAGAELLKKISVTTRPGRRAQAKSDDEDVELEAMAYTDYNFTILEARLAFSAQLEGMKFELKFSPTGVFGMPWSYELGSLDGSKTFLLVITPELILEDDEREDAWALKEKGGEFLGERRLKRVEKSGEDKEAGEFRELLVMPDMIEDLTKAGDEGEASAPLSIFRLKKDELAGVGVVYDVKSLFEQNGISFREGDFLVFSQFQNRVYGRLSVQEHDRLEEVIRIRKENFPSLIRIDFKQVDRDERVLKKMGVTVLSGQIGEVSLGAELTGRVEVSLNTGSNMVEVRSSLTDLVDNPKKATIQAGISLAKGGESVIEVVVSDQLRAWKITADILSVDQVVREYRQELRR